MSSHSGNFFLLGLGKYLYFIEQETELLCEGFVTLFRGRAKLLMPYKAQRLHKQIHLVFQMGNTLVLGQKLLPLTQ